MTVRKVGWIWAAAAGVITLTFTIQSLRDPDVWWHLSLGRLIATSGIPKSEPFSFVTPHAPWVGQQWGFELGLWQLFSHFGGAGPMLVMALVGSVAFVIAAMATFDDRKVSPLLRAGSLWLSALVAGQLLGVRGQVVSVLGVAITWWVINRFRAGSKNILLVLPPLFAVWANLHAGFIAGLVLVWFCIIVLEIEQWANRTGAEASHLDVRWLSLVAIASFAATLLNPAGSGIYSYIANTFNNPVLTQMIVEWRSPDFHNTFVRLFEMETILLVAAWILSARPRTLDVAVGLTFFVASIYTQRNVAEFAVIATGQLAHYGSLAWQRFSKKAVRRPAFSGAFALVVGVVATAVVIAPDFTSTAIAQSSAKLTPQGSVDYVVTNYPQQHVYSTYEWGGYLSYRFPSTRNTFVYGESSILGSTVLNQYLDIHLLKANWQQILTKYDMHVAVLPAETADTSLLLQAGWTAVCYDAASSSVVLNDQPSPTAPLNSAGLKSLPHC